MFEKIYLKTQGHTDFLNITEEVQDIVSKAQCQEGIIFLFAKGSTCALTTMEWEEGIKKDVKSVLEKIAPEDFDWQHHKKWGDHNGAAHIRSALMGPDLFIPFEKGKLTLGAWQSVVFIDFDEKPREREIEVKIICG